MPSGTIYLIPTFISESAEINSLAPISIELIQKIDCFIVENTRSARRFISALKINKNIDEITFFEFNKTNVLIGLKEFIQSKKGMEIGVLSEAGCPCIADPGAEAVKFAHEFGMNVVPIPGPSSIILSLMGSGFNGQSFVFHGYIPIDKNERLQTLLRLENESSKKKQTQIFIETPYRNNSILFTAVTSLKLETKICVAANLTQPDQYLKTKTVRQWQGNLPDLNKIPTIFLLSAV